ncbi:MAG: RES family NAD+ phosphorylase [Bacteroidetes bacterium]|nr:RES family NAD+ phosphorylase [Bacteroidota bacterium]
MLLYRITNAKYAGDLSGNGARYFGGRWNSIGQPMLYLASSRSLAILESLAHIVPTNVPNDYLLLTIDAPDDYIAVSADLLPDKWNEYPESNITKQIGNAFLQRNEYLLLKVPSALVPEEFNYLMNPLHSKADRVKVINRATYRFDDRLL